MEYTRAVRWPLGWRGSVEDAAAAFRREPGLVALSGAWGGPPGHAIVASRPLRAAPTAADPFATLGSLPALSHEAAGGAAFGGGWFGYLGYQLGHGLERLGVPPPRPFPLPDCQLAFYDHLLLQDHAGQWWFEALLGPATTTATAREHAARLETTLAATAPPPAEPAALVFRPHPQRAGHEAAVRRALEYIAAGDCYQVNLAIRLEARGTVDALDLWRRGNARMLPARAAFIATAEGAIASFSPELFLQRRGSTVLTSPIKGTAPRRDYDPAPAALLQASPKNRAENLMIVDLMRNDLGRVCRPGSMRVPALFRAEPHPGLWHLVSDVMGELRPGLGDADLLRATFPPGSITGAPKIRAMQIIDELELTAREVYCGAIGFASPLAGLELNVAIRSFEIAGDRAWLGAGGGIVADSDPADEWRECLAKAAPLIDAIGARLEAGG